MNTERFNEIIEQQIERSRSVLVAKADEYATLDRLHNFRTAAKLQGLTEEQALGGMLAKHTVSIFDMISSGDSKSYSEAMWNEKITDSMNYHLLLRAIVQERLERQWAAEDEKESRRFEADPTDFSKLEPWERELLNGSKVDQTPPATMSELGAPGFRRRYDSLTPPQRTFFHNIWDVYAEGTKYNESLTVPSNLKKLFVWAFENYSLPNFSDRKLWDGVLKAFEIDEASLVEDRAEAKLGLQGNGATYNDAEDKPASVLAALRDLEGYNNTVDSLNTAEKKLFHDIWDAYMAATGNKATLAIRENLQAMFTWAANNFVMSKDDGFNWRTLIRVFKVNP